ncbi:MAG: hypothetical protein EBZ48_02100 [Proteobacteria bacterium]|nr:hypothetical protein [Pseudomonadota bacterium]
MTIEDNTAEECDSLDFIELLQQKKAAAEELLEASRALQAQADEARQQLAEQAEIDRDLKDGSVEALLRVKARMNAKLDAMIAKALEA